MTTETPTTSFMTMSEDRFKTTLAVVIAVVTALTGIIAFLQGDASARDDQANRDTNVYALQSLGSHVGGDAQVNFDYYKAYQTWYELDTLADSAAARGDEAAAARYATLRAAATELSPLLAEPYFDSQTGETDVAAYEAQVYLVDVTALGEKYLAAYQVKQAWDVKANTYIVHLTMLAVALFLFGLSITIARPATRWIFSGVGALVTVIAVIWAAVTYAGPVYDLRQQGDAIGAYARGAGLAYQGKWEQAVGAYDEAIAAAPTYAHALAARAEAHLEMDDTQAAIADYEAARAAGDNTAVTAGSLAWLYYQMGRFDDAAAMNRLALEVSPDELWIQFDLALSLLAAGQSDAAEAAYVQGMEQSSRLVAAARANAQEPSSLLWWSLDDAALSLDDLFITLDTGEGQPAPETIANPQAAQAAAESLVARLKSLSVALEYDGRPPQGELTARLSPFTFAEPVYDETGEVVEYVEADEFEFGVSEVSVLFDYEGIQRGDRLIAKVYVDGEEDPSWRTVTEWDDDPSGSMELPLSMGYSDVFVLAPGEYQVDMYVGDHLAGSGVFQVLED